MLNQNKVVSVVEVRTVGFTAKRNMMRVEIPSFPSATEIEAIEYAIKHILAGRQVVLSGTEIQPAPVPPGFVADANLSLAEYISEISQLKRTIEEREECYAKLKTERERLQAIIDSVDQAFMDVSRNSTRGKQRDARMRNSRFGGSL